MLSPISFSYPKKTHFYKYKNEISIIQKEYFKAQLLFSRYKVKALHIIHKARALKWKIQAKRYRTDQSYKIRKSDNVRVISSNDGKEQLSVSYNNNSISSVEGKFNSGTRYIENINQVGDILSSTVIFKDGVTIIRTEDRDIIETNFGYKLTSHAIRSNVIMEEFLKEDENFKYYVFKNRKNQIYKVSYTFKNGCTLTYGINNSLIFTYTNKNLGYKLDRYGSVTLSKGLTELLFYSSKPKSSYVDDLIYNLKGTQFAYLLYIVTDSGIKLHEIDKVFCHIVNHYRDKLQLPLLNSEKTLSIASKHHSNYLLKNYINDLRYKFPRLPSNEDPTLFDYYEGTTYLRSKKAGYIFDKTNKINEITYLSTDPINDAIYFLSTYFKRTMVLSPVWKEIGLGITEYKDKRLGVLTYVYGRNKKPDTDIIVFPQSNFIPLLLKKEFPPPVSYKNIKYGYPVTIKVINVDRYRINKMRLLKYGREVVKYTTQKLFEGEKKYKYPGIIPNEPLRPNTKYKVHLIYTDDGEEYEAEYVFKTTITPSDYYDLFFPKEETFYPDEGATMKDKIK